MLAASINTELWKEGAVRALCHFIATFSLVVKATHFSPAGVESSGRRGILHLHLHLKHYVAMLFGSTKHGNDGVMQGLRQVERPPLALILECHVS